MGKKLIRLALLIGVPALTWTGFVNGVEGAMYLVKFFVWAICLPISFPALSTPMQQALAKDPAPGLVHKWVSRASAWLVLGVMVWTGHIATACAWGFYLLCAAVASEGAKKLRAEASAAQAA